MGLKFQLDFSTDTDASSTSTNQRQAGHAWGPSLQEIPTRFQDIPYAPFSKADKLGRVADWYEPSPDEQQQHQQGKGYRGGAGGPGGGSGKYSQRQQQQQDAFGTGVSTAFSYFHAEDEASFSLVDRTGAAMAATPASAAPRSMGGKKPFVAGGQGGGAWGAAGARKASAGGGNQRYGGQQQQQQRGGPGGGGYRRYGGNWQDRNRIVRDSSVVVGPQWKTVEEYQLQAFTKLLSEVEEAKDIGKFGLLHHYDRAFDRITTKMEKPVRTVEEIYQNVTVSQDPVIQTMLETNKMPNGKPVVAGDLVFISAQILAGLMTAPRSINSWDLVVKHVHDAKHDRHLIYFDKRKGSSWDFIPVDETSANPPQEIVSDKQHVNGPTALAVEAAEINKNFVQQVLKKAATFPFGEKENPVEQAADGPVVPVGYRYRMWDMRALASEEGTRPVSLIARTELNAVLPQSAEKVNLVTLHALNEYFPADPNTGALQTNYVDWRSKLDGQRGAVMANEMRNNAWKFARWAVEAILAEADQMKIGFVTRTIPNNPSRGHILLGMQSLKPVEFAKQLNIDMNQCWGVMKSLVDIFVNLPAGDYVLLKDPNEQKVTVYSVPAGSLPLDGDAVDGEDAQQEE